MPTLADSRHSCPCSVNGSDERIEQPLRELAHVALARDVLGEHDEFVAAEARGGVGRADRVASPLRHDLQHLVAGDVAEARR